VTGELFDYFRAGDGPAYPKSAAYGLPSGGEEITSYRAMKS
jgi:hypothetical protein